MSFTSRCLKRGSLRDTRRRYGVRQVYDDIRIKVQLTYGTTHIQKTAVPWTAGTCPSAFGAGIALASGIPAACPAGVCAEPNNIPADPNHR